MDRSPNDQQQKIQVGTYYGKQEKEPVDTVERDFSQLKTQIQKMSKNGPNGLQRQIEDRQGNKEASPKQKRKSPRRHAQCHIPHANL